MSSDPGSYIVRQSLDATQKTTQSGTETLVHEANGSTRLGIAIKFQINHANDLLIVQSGMKIPGSSSTTTDDDYFVDHFHTTTYVGGTGSIAPAANQKSTGQDHQHVIIVGPYWGTPGEWLIRYSWATNAGNNADLIALHTWTLPGGSY